MTNSDVIKTMTDEQLARFLWLVEDNAIRVAMDCDGCTHMVTCSECGVIWLRSDAEGENGLLLDENARLWEGGRDAAGESGDAGEKC